MKKLLVILVLVSLVLVACQPKVNPVAVTFNATNGQGITFPNGASIDNLVTKTISYWVNQTTSNGAGQGSTVSKYTISGAVSGWWSSFFNHNFYFAEMFSGSNYATWHLNSTPSSNSPHMITISYDHSSTANSPIIYVDGAVSAITVDIVPTGTIVAETNNIDVGFDNEFANTTLTGTISDIRIYNRILSTDEITTLYNNQNKHVVLSGLVFWAPFVGSAGLTAFDNVTLTSSNKLLDIIGNTLGTPAGSPKGSTTIALFGGNSADSIATVQTATGVY
jgi:uncharacterized protein YcfL